MARIALLTIFGRAGLAGGMRELRELLEEAKKEAEEHEPNMVKLKTLLIDCKKIVQTFAALDPMWQGVQHITRMIGIL